MKKYMIMLLLTVFIIPISVKAAATYNVLTLEGSQANNKISYSGTTEEGVYAVSCSLINSDNKEIDFKSSSVSDKKFSDTFDAEEGNYTIKCANYDGGTYVTTIVIKGTTSNNATDTKTTSNPTTLDDILKYVIILVGAIVVLGTGFVIYKKKQK